ncbi:hypothetical protein FA09DRAFT_328871 [Tilletiopsis washingtonensis]|uniref:CUE domain-containing protein n=1 Tax=Tilletiopsis washingtonensis TaxID=58919 RepID=A0A316ZGP3_9BASI|nr:hypothetical protein FA09DRAFT_328871 [Tilletiopsis washingtonensis]PWN99485.1 hypothetical protein FA09DRAFT_328871 [Tilletiopsis washingtonensis]
MRMRSHGVRRCRRGREKVPEPRRDVEVPPPLMLCPCVSAAAAPRHGAQPERGRARAMPLPRVPPPSSILPPSHMQDTLGALLAVGLVYVVVRFAFGSSSGSSSAGSGGGGAGVPGGASVAPQAGAQRGAAQRRNMAGVSDEMVQAVTSMFPHVSPEAIRYDLARSGSAEATADRILSEGALPNPPAGLFGPPRPAPPPPRAPESASAASSASARTSLIKSFNLEARLSAPAPSEAAPAPAAAEKGKEKSKANWSDERATRERELRARKEEMILAARRRLQAKQSGA